MSQDQTPSQMVLPGNRTSFSSLWQNMLYPSWICKEVKRHYKAPSVKLKQSWAECLSNAHIIIKLKAEQLLTILNKNSYLFVALNCWKCNSIAVQRIVLSHVTIKYLLKAKRHENKFSSWKKYVSQNAL